MFDELTVEEKIRRGRIELQEEEPFFSHILMNLKLREVDIPHPMGVNMNGTLAFSPKIIEEEGFSLDIVKGILVHESIHIAFKHLFRRGEMDKRIWNFATDVVANYIVKKNGYELPEGIITGDRVGVDKVEEKSAEEVYKELIDKAKKRKVGGGGSGRKGGKKGNKKRGSGNRDKKKKKGKKGGGGKEKKKGDGDREKEGTGYNREERWGRRIDKHIGGKENRENKKKIKEWEEKIDEARKIAKRQGSLPNGVKRKIGNLLKPKIDWRTVLYKYITRVIPFDYTWIRPSKSTLSGATDYYLPSVKRENIDIVATIDTSGSVGEKELTKFVSELRNIQRSFEQIDVTLLVGDCKIQEVYKRKFRLEDINWEGGGGTDHRMYYKWIGDNKPNSRIVIHLTDGYSSFPRRNVLPNLNSIWVLTKNHIEKDEIPFGKKVVMR